MSQDEFQSAQQELFDTLVPVLLLGTLVLGWLLFVLPVPTQVADAQVTLALVGRWTATTGAVLLVGGPVWALRKRGYVQAATYTLVVGLTVLTAAALALWPDVAGSALPYLYPLLVIIAGLLIRPLAALFTVGLIVLALLAALLAGGELSPRTIVLLLPTLLLTGLAAVIAWLSIGRLLAALSRVAQSEAQLRSQTQSLQASRGQIEHAVARLQANQAQLAEARRALKERQSATPRLLANLSRNFRVPLNAIVNFAHILAEGRRGPVTEDQRGYLRRMHAAGEHLLRTLTDLADLAGAEAGEVELNRQPVDLSQLGEEAIQSIATAIQDRRLELNNAIPSDLPHPLADEACVRRVLLNLLENAIQHSRQGQVTLSAEPQDGEVVVSVWNNGPGIRPEDLERIFEPFGPSSGVPAQSRVSSDLRLPISKQLVELHGGRIWVNSQMRMGTTVYFTLPLQPTPVHPADEEGANGESFDFETALVFPWADEERLESAQYARSQLRPVARMAPVVRERFIAIGLVGLLSVLALVVGGMALHRQESDEGARPTRGAMTVTTLPGPSGTAPTSGTLTPIPLAVIKSPTSTPTPLPLPTSTATATPETKLPTPTASPSHTPDPTATVGRPTDTPTATPTDTPTATPTDTPTATPTPVPTTGPASTTSTTGVEGTPPPARIVFTANREGQFDIYAMSPDGTGLARLTADPADDRAPVVSPDGKRVLFYSEREGNSDLYAVDADGKGLVRLTNDPARDESPAWSPDGETIAFASHRQGNYDLYVADADGGNVVRLTTTLAWEGAPTWSPDGQRIALVSDQTGYDQICVMGSDGTRRVCLTDSETDHWAPAWSPDGTRLVFYAVDSTSGPETDGGRSIFVIDADGENLTRLTDATGDDVDPTWTPDGQILFASNRSGNYDLYEIASDGSHLTRLTDTPFDELEPAWATGF